MDEVEPQQDFFDAEAGAQRYFKIWRSFKQRFLPNLQCQVFNLIRTGTDKRTKHSGKKMCLN